MPAYYNEIDPYAAQWLRNLIASGHIAPGDVDERDIRDVRPGDLAGYTQCHFFAGIGVWSRALRDAGWPDDRPVWTGSCPCQPFSAAGQRGGFADERHLWPAFFHLIAQCRPARILGEQVASPDALQWLDLVSADLEAAGYAFGAADLCAAGDCVAAGETETGRATIEWIRRAVLTCPDPVLAAELSDFAEWSGGSLGYGPAHIRQRLCWAADAMPAGWSERRPGAGDRSTSGSGGTGGMADAAIPRSLSGACAGIHRGEESSRAWHGESKRCRNAGIVADADGGDAGAERKQRGGQQRLVAPHGCDGAQRGALGELGDAACDAQWQSRLTSQGGGAQEPARGSGISRVSDLRLGDADDARSQGRSEHRHVAGQRIARPSGVARYADPDWIVCTDGKARPVEPGSFPLAHGIAGRVGRLRGYGNAMHLGKIAAFIRAADDACTYIRTASEVAP